MTVLHSGYFNILHVNNDVQYRVVQEPWAHKRHRQETELLPQMPEQCQRFTNSKNSIYDGKLLAIECLSILSVFTEVSSP